MTRERYNPGQGRWEDSGAPTTNEMAADIYEQVGERFRIEWENGVPVVDFDDLPESVGESEARQAIEDNVAQRGR